MESYYHALTQLFASHSNAEDAPMMKKYMRNQFEFYGIKSPLRRELLRTFLRENGKPALKDVWPFAMLCWNDPHRELQYAALDILVMLIKKMTPADLPFIEDLILKKSWWDTVDGLAPQFAGSILLLYPDEIKRWPDRWINVENMWLRRSAILFQLKYKERTNPDLLFDYILKEAGSKEFFIQKASGWALREYSKTNPDSVIAFIEQNDLAPLTRREGFKWIRKL